MARRRPEGFFICPEEFKLTIDGALWSLTADSISSCWVFTVYALWMTGSL